MTYLTGLLARRTAALAIVGAAVALIPVQTTMAPPEQQSLPSHTEFARDLVERHDCWTGDAPADVTVPGHVVITLLDGKGESTFVGGRRLVGPALDYVLAGDRSFRLHGGEATWRIGTVHAFCR